MLSNFARRNDVKRVRGRYQWTKQDIYRLTIHLQKSSKKKYVKIAKIALTDEQGIVGHGYWVQSEDMRSIINTDVDTKGIDPKLWKPVGNNAETFERIMAQTPVAKPTLWQRFKRLFNI